MEFNGVSCDQDQVSVELKQFMRTDEHFIRMQREMVRFASIEPAVATYALLKTKMQGVARATDFIFDKRRGPEGLSKMHHPFVGIESDMNNENSSVSSRLSRSFIR